MVNSVNVISSDLDQSDHIKWLLCGFILKVFSLFDTHNGESRGQFHQHFTSSFYVHRSQKRKKESQVKQLFALSGSVGVKSGRKHVGEIDPRFLPQCAFESNLERNLQ